MSRPTTLELFGSELRRARTAAGFSLEGLSPLVQYSPSTIAKVETAARRPRLDFVRRCEKVLHTDGLLLRIHATIGPDAGLPWYREWFAIESTALALRWFELSIVPGLLQTEEYARTLLRAGGLLDKTQIEEQVTTRLDRQAVLTRDQPPHFAVVIDERVIRQPVGGPRVMAEQLRHLLAVCDAQPRVRIQVVPIATGAYAGLNGPFVIAIPAEGDEVAFRDNQGKGELVEEPGEVAAMRQLWESVKGEALSYQQSIELIGEVAESWS
ncbi:helix-turn-helix transcriptional regulator [Solwaraspora sp. WMMD1047]|uniref:helix-turn-helix domain-containing protein n=1 Tax=Solwaraspora sp. WMMD1047 TaxID=3016102 RepID=UPI002417B38E|nr:helix-turn-helix transcriptional regulator [Solwaraspora sp. WMMD1047]MDG4828649.1 helix-turn-helix transcriptional regulator [Solwaraspora sp. WMMD1047]